jgi:large subunit ribosomal protein L15
MKLNDIRDNHGARKSRMRVGRGIGSGKGKTAGRGQKGAKARSGVSVHGFEGGQMPLHMRIPKRGFNNIFAKDYAEVNLGLIQKFIDAGRLDAKAVIDHDALKAVGLARGGKDGVRLLGKGEFTAKARFFVTGVSKGAREAVERAGGSVTVPEAGQTEHEKKSARRDMNSEKARRNAAIVTASQVKRENAYKAPPYTPHHRGTSPLFINVNSWLQKWHNETPEELVALLDRLADKAGTGNTGGVLEAITEAGELLRAAMNEAPMSSRVEITPRDAKKAAAMQAVLHELQKGLLSPNVDVARRSAVALALACGADRANLFDIAVDTELSDAQAKRLSRQLSALLFRNGDRSFSSIFLISKHEIGSETLVRGGFRLSRALPFALGKWRVILPDDGLPKLTHDMVEVVASGASVELLDEPPLPEIASDEAVLYACTFVAHLPRPMKRQAKLSILIGNFSRQRYVITPQALAAIPSN